MMVRAIHPLINRHHLLFAILEMFEFMVTTATGSPPPECLQQAARKNYIRTEQEIIDEDLHVTIFRSGRSCSWYVQFNHPVDGQRKQSLRTKNKKEARRRAWKVIDKLQTGELSSAVR